MLGAAEQPHERERNAEIEQGGGPNAWNDLYVAEFTSCEILRISGTGAVKATVVACSIRMTSLPVE